MAFAPQPNAYQVEGNVLGARFVTMQFTAGAAGAAPTSLTHGGNYVSLVTKSTNDYVMSLRAKWFRMVPIGVSIRQASFSAAGASYGNITVDNVNGTTPSFTLSFYKGSDGTAVALATGDVVIVTIELTNEKI